MLKRLIIIIFITTTNAHSSKIKVVNGEIIWTGNCQDLKRELYDINTAFKRRAPQELRYQSSPEEHAKMSCSRNITSLVPKEVFFSLQMKNKDKNCFKYALETVGASSSLANRFGWDGEITTFSKSKLCKPVDTEHRRPGDIGIIFSSYEDYEGINTSPLHAFINVSDNLVISKRGQADYKLENYQDMYKTYPLDARSIGEFSFCHKSFYKTVTYYQEAASTICTTLNFPSCISNKDSSGYPNYREPVFIIDKELIEKNKANAYQICTKEITIEDYAKLSGLKTNYLPSFKSKITDFCKTLRQRRVESTQSCKEKNIKVYTKYYRCKSPKEYLTSINSNLKELARDIDGAFKCLEKNNPLRMSLSPEIDNLYGLRILIPIMEELLEINENKSCSSISKSDLAVFSSFISDIGEILYGYETASGLSKDDRKLIQKTRSLVTKLIDLPIYKPY